VFVYSDLAGQIQLWRDLGYEQTNPQKLGVQAWQEAARETMPEGSTLYFKQLRQDRVMRPI
jgi:dephospho-CoA kinase